MIYISYFTKSTPYVQVAKSYLIPSLARWNLRYDVRELPSQGDWLHNVALKPGFILDMLNEYKEDVTFLDADATIEQSPDLLNSIPSEYDIAVHYLDWKTWYGKGDKKELLSGTMFLRNNSKVKELCKEWSEEAKKGERWEQSVLANILKERTDINIYELPLSYCYIKSRPNDKQPLVLLNPVILHHQVSRKYKRKKL